MDEVIRTKFTKRVIPEELKDVSNAFSALPNVVIWDMTYACPLRCSHCYSESGRRPAKQLSFDKLLLVARIIRDIKPAVVAFSGGEPLLVKGVFELARLLEAGGTRVSLFTSGYLVDKSNIEEIVRSFSQIHISVDGADAKTHDFIRGKKGSFDLAMHALSLLERKAQDRRNESNPVLKFGIDCVIIRSNVEQLSRFCTEIAPQFPSLQFINMGAAVPAGLANRLGFSTHELLTEDQLGTLRDSTFRQQLESMLPATMNINLEITDNIRLQMHPDHLLDARARNNAIQIEPDGGVRGSLIYEGTVGNILHDPIALLWDRVQAHHRDPFFVEMLSSVHTMQDWAEAARRIDAHFASMKDRRRILTRREYIDLMVEEKQDSW